MNTAYEFIELRDFDTAPARYAEYLRDTLRSAQATLEKPVEQWPRGDSHEISRQIIAECLEAYEDAVLEFGEFDAHGRLTGFADA